MNGQVASIDPACPNSLPKTRWHWPTVVFAAVPATLLAFPASSAVFAFLLCYTGASIMIAVATLIGVYIGMRTQRRRQTRLRITQMVLSFLLLLISVPIVG